MEFVIFERRQSVCCRDGEIFRKYFKYANKQAAEHEGRYSRLYENLGINTPHFLRTGFSSARGLYFNDYRYMNLQPLNEANVDEKLPQRVLAILNRASAAKPSADGEDFWNQHYRADLLFALGILKNCAAIDVEPLLQEVLGQEVSVVMHGDFSLSNMALVDDELYLYDFASAGCSPKWWDFGYFIASLSPHWGLKLYEPFRHVNLLACIKLAAAVKFGRSLRKREKVAERQTIFKYWSEISSS